MKKKGDYRDDWYEGCIHDRLWRLNHLYYILDKDGKVVRFRLNWAQMELYNNLWHRNLILKARQLGMSTFTSLFMLDCCLHKRNFQAGIIDKSMPDAVEKLDKIRFALQCMVEPPAPRDDDPVKDETARHNIACYSQLIASAALVKTPAHPEGSIKDTVLQEKAVFANGSKIRLGTSLRGGTLQLLHVSEFGYIANNNPTKAIEILSGGVNAVSQENIVIMESTHEGGKYGEHYRIMRAAMDAQGRQLAPLEYKFFFFPWWKQKEYSVTGEGHAEYADEYFDGLERQGITLTEQQKRWYCVQEQIFGYRVKTEYPSTPDEAFTQQVEGAIYGPIISRLRAKGLMAQEFEPDPYYPLYVSWDLGMSDYTSMWLIQPHGHKFYVIDYYCANKKLMPHYINKVQEWERRFNRHIELNLLPHDGGSLGGTAEVTFQELLSQAGFVAAVVPKTQNVWRGIYLTRDLLQNCVFHKRCGEPVRVDGFEYMSGVDALENYQSGRLGANGVERLVPLHDLTSHGADAFRTFVEGHSMGYVSKDSTQKRYDPRYDDEPESREDKAAAAKCDGVPDFW